MICIAKCGHPELLSTVSNESVPNVVGYDDIIPVEGTTIWFSCPPGLVITGSNSATCMENGEWDPDPSGVKCGDSKGKMFLMSTLLKLSKSPITLQLQK